MSGNSVINDNSYILKEVEGDKFTSGVIFGLDSKVLQCFGLDLFRPVGKYITQRLVVRLSALRECNRRSS